MRYVRTRLNIHVSFVVYLLTIALLASLETCIGAIIALVVHELAHLIAGRCVGEEFDCIELTPFGGVMTSKRKNAFYKGWRGALVAAAGPMGNYAMILALATPALQQILGNAISRQAMLANAVMMLFNLLPALPLDGGRVVFSLGCYSLGVSRMIRVLCNIGIALGVMLISVSAFGFAHYGVLNLSALIVGAYLIESAVRSRSALLVQNLYAVVHERSAQHSRCKRMQIFEVDSQTTLLSLLEPMERCDVAGFVIRSESSIRFIDEESVCKALLLDAMMPIGDVKCEKAQKRSPKHELFLKHCTL